MRTLVVAPHPDDETLGCGGTLLRRKNEGSKIAWLLVTRMSVNQGWSQSQIEARNQEIEKIQNFFDFDDVFKLEFDATQLDQLPISELVIAISDVLHRFKPTEVLVPHPSDVHTDHRVTFDATVSSVKWFRSPSISRVLAYETLSDTEFGLSGHNRFHPNVFVNIGDQLEMKLRAIEIYQSEVQDFPFPRSRQAITALAKLRGSNSGFQAAEAFELLREFS